MPSISGGLKLQRMMEIINIVFSNIKKFVNIFLWLISPLAFLMLIVAIIMLMDFQGKHHRQRAALEEEPLVATATITSCFPEERFCYAEFTDITGRERHGRLDWRYYSNVMQLDLKSLGQWDRISVRYARDKYADDIVLANHYGAFLTYRGYYFDMGGIALVSWGILMLHPEIMLIALVKDLETYIDKKWNRITGLT